ncbi:unnamed protein product [Closterium sp. NIES-53]
MPAAAVAVLGGNECIADYPAHCASPPHPARTARHKSASRPTGCAGIAGGVGTSEAREGGPVMDARSGWEYAGVGKRGSPGSRGMHSGEEVNMRGRGAVDMDVLWADPAVGRGGGDRDARADNGGEGGEYDDDDEEHEAPALERLEAVSRHSTPSRFSLNASPEVPGAGRERSAEGIPRPRTGGHGARGMHDGAQAQRGDGAAKVHPRTRALRASHHRRWASFDGSNAMLWDGEDISRAHSAENSARLPWGGAAEQQLQSSLHPDSLLRDPSASAVGSACPKPSVRRTRTRQQRQPRANASSQLQMRSRSDRLGESGNQSDGEVEGGGALAGEGSSDDDELFRPTPPRMLGGVGARSGRWASASSGERGSVLAAWQQRELAQVEEKLRHAGDGGEMTGGALAGASQGRGMDGLGDERRRLGGEALWGRGEGEAEAEAVGATEGDGSESTVRGAQDDALASEMMTRGLLDDADVDARENGSRTRSSTSSSNCSPALSTLPLLPYPCLSTLSSTSLSQFATDGFARENILGEGGFGTVYRGLLPVAPRVEVAVKVLKQLGVQADEEFHIELELLSRLDHKNLVRLHGFCSTATQRMLVYEYLPNGSLTDHLHGPPGTAELSWERRVRIAAGAARGLAHLHRQRPQILHRDVKAPNILLTSNFTAKVADFGCAKLIRRTEVVEDAVTGRQVERLCDSVDYAMGTPGHMAPEMLMTGEISAATDVYSFGVVLLQLVTGRLPIDSNRQQLTTWAAPLLEEERWEELVDPRLQRALLGRANGGGAGGGGGGRGGEDGAGAGAGAGAVGELRRLVAGRSVGRCVQLAGTCLDMDPLQRPSMEDVALSLLAIYSSACAERDEALQPASEGFRSGRMLPPAGPSDPTRAGSGGSGMPGAVGGGSGAVVGGSARMTASSGGLSVSPERPAGTAKARFQRNRSARHTSFG